MTIPKLSEIEASIITAIEGKLGQTIPAFPKAFFRVFSKGVAGVVWLTYHFVAWCLDQTQPATANDFWLTIWGDRYGVVRAPAVAARLTATATGTDGSTIDAGTQWKSPAGVVYSQETAVTITGGVATITVVCLAKGEAGNLGNGVELSTVSPVAGIDNTATTTATLTSGVDRQGLESYRAEVMARIAYRPQGGAIPDYVAWALEVPGIVKAFVKRPAAGDVNVYPLVDVTGISRIPDAPKIAEVLAYLTDPVRKPLAANVYVIAPTERTCATTITGATINGSALSASQKASVESAIMATLYAAYPRQYIDQPAPTDTVSTAMVWAALVAIGATATAVTISVSGIGGGPYVLPIGEIVAPGVVTWA